MPLSNSRPSTNLRVVWFDLPSSRVIKPFCPTSLMAAAISSPICELADEIVAIFLISSFVLIGLLFIFMISLIICKLFSRPFFIDWGLAPASIYLMPSLMIVSARTQAVVVPSPAILLVFMLASLMSFAPRFSKALASSISFAIVTPSLVIRGEPYGLSKTTFLPFGPSVDLTTLASFWTPSFNFFLASSPVKMSFISFPPKLLIYLFV